MKKHIINLKRQAAFTLAEGAAHANMSAEPCQCVTTLVESSAHANISGITNDVMTVEQPLLRHPDENQDLSILIDSRCRVTDTGEPQRQEILNHLWLRLRIQAHKARLRCACSFCRVQDDVMGVAGRQKAAFTLAEVLIALGIIGIVAAMTIPNLISKYRKQAAETALKENYSIIQQAMKFSEVDGISVLSLKDDLASMKSWFETYMLPYIKTEKVCYNEAGCWQTSGPTKALSGQTATWNRTGVGMGNSIIIFRLANGANIVIDGCSKGDLSNYFGVTINSTSGLAMYMDVNGDKGPNVIGQDIYAVVYSTDGRLVPAGSSKTGEEVTANCSAEATDKTAGYYCMQYVINNNWKISDDIWNLKIN